MKHEASVLFRRRSKEEIRTSVSLFFENLKVEMKGHGHLKERFWVNPQIWVNLLFCFHSFSLSFPCEPLFLKEPVVKPS